MDLEEAKEWIKGDRSQCNMIPRDPFDTYLVRCAEADAYAVQQAYWVLKAYKERLLEG